jgi:hypothetical protein
LEGEVISVGENLQEGNANAFIMAKSKILDEKNKMIMLKRDFLRGILFHLTERFNISEHGSLCYNCATVRVDLLKKHFSSEEILATASQLTSEFAKIYQSSFKKLWDHGYMSGPIWRLKTFIADKKLRENGIDPLCVLGEFLIEQDDKYLSWDFS